MEFYEQPEVLRPKPQIQKPETIISQMDKLEAVKRNKRLILLFIIFILIVAAMIFVVFFLGKGKNQGGNPLTIPGIANQMFGINGQSQTQGQNPKNQTQNPNQSNQDKIKQDQVKNWRNEKGEILCAGPKICPPVSE